MKHGTWTGFLPPQSLVMARTRCQTQDRWEQVAADLDGCTRCKLCEGRSTIVIGEGNPTSAQLIFIGEGPGEQDDLPGQLLHRMIEAMGLSREKVYITNIVKCRPPGDRHPEPDEIATCSPFLLRQIELIRPKVIVTFGELATRTLLQTEFGLAELRGKFQDYRGAKLMPTFHPAHLLRNPESKREAWDDLQAVARELGMQIPKRSN